MNSSPGILNIALSAIQQSKNAGPKATKALKIRARKFSE